MYFFLYLCRLNSVAITKHSNYSCFGSIKIGNCSSPNDVCAFNLIEPPNVVFLLIIISKSPTQCGRG